MTVVTTSTSPTATAYSNQRKIDRCQNGVLWAIHDPGTANGYLPASYSIDNGVTWISAGNQFVIYSGGAPYLANSSLFIDLDDYAHVVYKDGGTGLIYYRRGTPNAARTAWTWSAAVVLTSSEQFDLPDVVAHRDGSGWVAHVVYGDREGWLGYQKAVYCPITVASGGTLTLGSSTILSAGPSNSVAGYPSIDFNHIGDGKTVAGGTPHLYVAWSAGAAGAGLGIRFRKAIYSAGVWTWDLEREIDSTLAIIGIEQWLNCLFDGTRIIIVGCLHTGSQYKIIINDRDAADTTTTPRSLFALPSNSQLVLYGSATYDPDGNVYLFGVNRDNSNGARTIVELRWSRLGGSTSTSVVETTGPDAPYLSVKRGYSNSRIEFIYTDGTASPYNIIYSSIVLNSTPNIPTGLAVTSDILDTTPVFQANVSDPDTSQQIKARFTIYKSGGGTVVGTVESGWVTGAHLASVEYASALPVGDYLLTASTVDNSGAVSSPTAQLAFSIKKTVEVSTTLLWNVDALISKDTSLLWDVQVSNQKDVVLVWDTTQQVETELTFMWQVKPAWIVVEPDAENNPVTWEEVLT